jgi:hypothetical protein
MEGIRSDEWFKKNYVPVRMYDDEDVNLDDVEAAFDDSKVSYHPSLRSQFWPWATLSLFCC